MIPFEFTTAHQLTLRGFSLNPIDPNKTTILCSHGWLDNANTWMPFFQCLTDTSQAKGLELDKRYNFLAIDFAGHGKSQWRSPDAHYHHIDYVFDIVQLIRDLKLTQVILLGHSMGGIVFSQVAAVLPSIVTQLISVEAMGPLSNDDTSAIEQITEAFNSRSQILARSGTNPISDKARIIQAKMAAGQLAQEHASLLIERNIETSIALSTDNNNTADVELLKWSSDKRLRTISTLRYTCTQAKQIMQAIECPVVCVIGETGFSRVKHQCEERASWVTQFLSHTIKGNHYCHMQSPSALLALIDKTLD